MSKIQPQLPGEPRELKLSFNYLRCFSSNATASYGWSILVSWFLWTHPHFFTELFTFKFQQFQDQNDAREGTPRVDRKLRSKYSTSLFSMDRRSIQHTRDLHIGNVMKHILINIDKTPVVVNHSLKLRFKQSHQFLYGHTKEFISRDHR